MIELQNVSKIYSNSNNSSIGLQNINLKLSKNEIVAITGESGSGKSTLLNIITKIDSFDDGEIFYKGNETSYFSIDDMDDFRKNKVGFIFQNYNILDSYTVLDNVMLPLLLKGLPKKEAKVKALDLIKKVGLEGRSKHRGSKLSGGEKQRCVIARALASDCEILACDEPTGNLDSKTSKEIIKLIKDVAKDKLVLIVTHNFDEVKDIVTRQIKIADGKIVEDIVYKPQEEDKKETLDLDYKPIKRKVLLEVAKNNVLFTPKKTILCALIMFIISFGFLFCTQLVSSMMKQSFNATIYNNSFENHLFVYNNHGEKIDKDKLSGFDYEINNFSVQNAVSVKVGNNYDRICYETNIPNTKLVEGRLPKSDKEFVIALNSNDTFNKLEYKKNLNQKLNVSVYGQDLETDFTLVGIMTYAGNISKNTAFATSCRKLQTLLDQISVNYHFVTEKENLEIYTYEFIKGSNEPELILPLEYQTTIGNNFKLFLENIYDYDNITVIYEDVNSPTIRLYKDGKLNIKPYFANVNVSPLHVKDTIKKLENKELQVIYPNQLNEDKNNIEYLITKILTLISTFQFILYLIGIFFITYIILSKVYQSKIKDYEILRTLGITKHDMAKLVNYEIVTIGILALVVNAVLFYTLIFTVPQLKILSLAGFDNLFIYIVVMILFSYFMSTRFNKRLFKFTVRKSIKGGEVDD